jgi:hypothetical protein
MLFLSVCVRAACAETPRQNPLIGTWLLVKFVDTPEHGNPIYAFGQKPVGYFIFSAGGHVAFSIMRNPPDITAPTTDLDPDTCVPVWYCAYFGTYTVDIANNTWVTHVTATNSPSYLGTDQPRHFRIDGDRLIISETYLTGSTRINAEREFIREAAAR